MGGHKGPFLAVQRLDCSYLPQKVSRSCGSGFGAECILPPASRAGISATTLWPLRHRWHWIQEETRGMCEAEIRKLEDIITALLALKNKYSSRQTLAFLSQTERLRRDDGDLLRSSAGARLQFDEEITHDTLCFNSNVDCFFSAASDKGKGQQDGGVCSTVTSRDVLLLQNRQHSPSSIMFPGNYHLHNTKVTSNQRQRSETQTTPPPRRFFLV